MVTKKQKKQMKTFGWILIGVGASLIIATQIHIGIQDLIGGHAILNLIAISVVLIGIWLKR